MKLIIAAKNLRSQMFFNKPPLAWAGAKIYGVQFPKLPLGIPILLNRLYGAMIKALGPFADSKKLTNRIQAILSSSQFINKLKLSKFPELVVSGVLNSFGQFRSSMVNDLIDKLPQMRELLNKAKLSGEHNKIDYSIKAILSAMKLPLVKEHFEELKRLKSKNFIDSYLLPNILDKHKVNPKDLYNDSPDKWWGGLTQRRRQLAEKYEKNLLFNSKRHPLSKLRLLALRLNREQINNPIAVAPIRNEKLRVLQELILNTKPNWKSPKEPQAQPRENLSLNKNLLEKQKADKADLLLRKRLLRILKLKNHFGGQKTASSSLRNFYKI